MSRNRSGRKSQLLGDQASDLNAALAAGKFPEIEPTPMPEPQDVAAIEVVASPAIPKSGPSSKGGKHQTSDRMVEVTASVPPEVKAHLAKVMNTDSGVATYGDAACQLFGLHYQQLKKDHAGRSARPDPENPFAPTGMLSRKKLPRSGGARSPLSLWVEPSQRQAIANLLDETNMSLPMLLSELVKLDAKNDAHDH